MRVAVNALPARGTHHGVGRYLINLMKALTRLDDNITYVVFCHSSAVEHFAALPEDRVKVVTLDVSPAARVLYEHFLLPMLMRREGIDVYLGATHILPLLKTTAQVVTIHDMSWFTVGQFHSRTKRIYFQALIPFSLARADAVITVSEATRRDILKLAPSQVRGKEIIAAPHGVGADFRPADAQSIATVRERFSLKRPYILNVGVMEPRKNQAGLIRAFRQMRSDKQHLDVDLVIVGSQSIGWRNDDIIESAKLPGLEDRVRLLGSVDDEALVALMSGCTIFAYPSFYEGFGLPILEAMACGATVLTSSTSSMPEVGGDAVAYVNPHDLSSLSEALAALLTDDAHRRRLADLASARAAEFNWAKCARLTTKAFRAAGRHRQDT